MGRVSLIDHEPRTLPGESGVKVRRRAGEEDHPPQVKILLLFMLGHKAIGVVPLKLGFSRASIWTFPAFQSRLSGSLIVLGSTGAADAWVKKRQVEKNNLARF